MLVVLNLVFQHPQSVSPCGVGMADGSPAATLQSLYHLCRACGVLCLHSLQLGMVGQECAALHQCHGVRVHLGDGVPRVVGQTADAVLDVQLVFAHHRRARVAQQFVVVQQASSNGVLDGRKADDCRVALDLLEHLFERRAAHHLHLLAVEVLPCGNVVERSQFALYRYFLHSWFNALGGAVPFKKAPLTHFCEAGLSMLFSLSIVSEQFHTALRFTEVCKVKVIAVKICAQFLHYCHVFY